MFTSTCTRIDTKTIKVMISKSGKLIVIVRISIEDTIKLDNLLEDFNERPWIYYSIEDNLIALASISEIISSFIPFRKVKLSEEVQAELAAKSLKTKRILKEDVRKYTSETTSKVIPAYYASSLSGSYSVHIYKENDMSDDSWGFGYIKVSQNIDSKSEIDLDYYDDYIFY